MRIKNSHLSLIGNEDNVKDAKYGSFLISLNLQGEKND